MCGTEPLAAAAHTVPPCARTFVSAITSADPTPGVWDCLGPACQTRVQGEGDAVFALNTPLWTHPRYLGQDHDIALFDLTVNGAVERAVYDPPVSHIVMAVYLDGHGLVDHTKAATPTG